MSVKHRKYTLKATGETVRVVEVTEKNYLNIQQWLLNYLPEDQVVAKVYVDKEGNESKHRVSFRTPKGNRVAAVGDWVIRHTKTPARGNKKGTYFFTVGEAIWENDVSKPLEITEKHAR